jgi:hypothetical protein
LLDFLTVLILAFCLEMVDNGLGGGFGTIMSPLLLIFGYDPKAVVPAILVSETVSGLWGGANHVRYGNVNWKAAAVTLAGSLAAMASASYAIGTYVPGLYVKWYISLLAFAMGVVVVVKSYGKIKPLTGDNFSKKWCGALGFAIGFNKGSTGGGYGPLSVSGYILLGIPAAQAIGTTTVAEGVACALGVLTYGATIGIAADLALPLAIGSFIADPASAWVNNRLKERVEPPFHGRLVGVAMTALGFITILKMLSG